MIMFRLVYIYVKFNESKFKTYQNLVNFLCRIFTVYNIILYYLYLLNSFFFFFKANFTVCLNLLKSIE